MRSKIQRILGNIPKGSVIVTERSLFSEFMFIEINKKTFKPGDYDSLVIHYKVNACFMLFDGDRERVLFSYFSCINCVTVLYLLNF